MNYKIKMFLAIFGSIASAILISVFVPIDALWKTEIDGTIILIGTYIAYKANPDNKKNDLNYDTMHRLFIFVFCILILIGIITGLTSSIVKSVDKIVPDKIMRTSETIVLTKDNVSIHSELVHDYTNPNPLMCRENRVNSFGISVDTTWRFCK